MKNIILVLGTCLLTTTTFAAGGTKAYDMYAPKAGGHEFVGGVNLLSAKFTSKAGPTDFDGSGYGLNLGYAYGFMDTLAFHVDQKYHGYKIESPGSTFDIKGPSLTTLGVKGLIDFGGPFFYYDAGYSMSLLAKRTSKTTETNMTADDREHLYATVGGGMEVGSIGFGANYKHMLFQNTDVENTTGSTNYKSSGGNRWNIYAQYDFGAKVGIAYGEQTTDAYDAESGGITTTNAVSKSESKSIQVYGIIPVSSELDLMADIRKGNLKDESAYSKYDSYMVSLSAKYNF